MWCFLEWRGHCKIQPAHLEVLPELSHPRHAYPKCLSVKHQGNHSHKSPVRDAGESRGIHRDQDSDHAPQIEQESEVGPGDISGVCSIPENSSPNWVPGSWNLLCTLGGCTQRSSSRWYFSPHCFTYMTRSRFTSCASSLWY